MKIKWYGHSCFLIETDYKILTDPFDQSVGYPFNPEQPDIITESHQHYDHNAHDRVKGAPAVVKRPGEHSFGSLRIRGQSTYHDEAKGKKRGGNIIFRFETSEGISIAHLGDIGHIPDNDTYDFLESLDVLMLPVGGYFTVAPDKAAQIVETVKPGIVIPMHYKTEYIPDFPIETEKPFLEALGWETKTYDSLVLNKLKLDELYKNCILFNI